VIAQLMRSADLFVLPSRLETFGAAIAEALTSGLPVVSTKVGGIPELVDESNGRLVPRDDAVALAEALADALESIDTFDRRAIAAAAAGRYDLKVVGEQLTQVYESVVTERGHAGR
jgi:glycosyltransferase involved in cell wall biosynthesis